MMMGPFSKQALAAVGQSGKGMFDAVVAFQQVADCFHPSLPKKPKEIVHQNFVQGLILSRVVFSSTILFPGESAVLFRLVHALPANHTIL